MYERFIIVGVGKMEIFWGMGDTIAEAEANYKKAGGKVKGIKSRYRFTSELPFCPVTKPAREATENESDAYMDTSGGLCWKRCAREEMAEVAAA